MPDREAEKRLAAHHAVRLIKNGMHVGLGSGSTAAYAIKFLGERIQTENLQISGVPTSPASRQLAETSGIPLAADTAGFQLDIAIDGADQATREGYLIKGGGGAMLHERIVDASARQFVVIGDSSKLVDVLGGFPLPIEVYQFGWKNAADRLRLLKCELKLREKDGQPFVSEEGNYIIDCQFEPNTLHFPHDLGARIRAIPGVADHGLFLGMAHLIVIACEDKITEIFPK